MERIAQSIITNVVKWTPPGVGISMTAHSLLSHEWMDAVLASFLTACASVWVKFSGEFMKEVEKDAEQSGRGLAYFLRILVRNTVSTFGEKAGRLWRQLNSDFEDKYYQCLVNTCRFYETQGLDRDISLELEHIFVPLGIKQGVSTNSHSMILKPAKKSEERLTKIGEWLVAMPNNPTQRRLVILGAPGSGKTTLMRYVTLAYAEREQHKRLHQEVPEYIPVLMYLREECKKIVKNPNTSLVDLLNERIQEFKLNGSLLKPPPNWFADKLKQNKCLILLDGLDEVADEKERQLVSQWVDSQMKDYSDTSFILTSRPLGYKHAKLQQEVTVLEVQPFTLNQAKEFVKEWYLRTEINSRASADNEEVIEEALRKADDLAQRIQDSNSLIAMSVNPLLLTMISTVHRRGNTLPEKRVELYREICQVLLEKRQRDKGILDHLTASQKQSVLQWLALVLMRYEQRSFRASDADTLLQGKLNALPGEPLTPAAFLKQIVEISGLIVAPKEGIYEFAHLSFQEYLASVEIRKSNRENVLIRALRDETQFSWWAETIRLYAAQGDCSNLIRSLMAINTTDTLQLAYECLEEGESVELPLRQELEDWLNKGLQSR